MSAFNNDPAEWQRLDWQLLQNSSVSLYYSPAILAADLAWLTDNGYVVRSLDAVDWQSSQEFLVALGKLLTFPDYFGRNLDAFNDCLSDIDVPEEGGMALVLHEFQRFSKPFSH